jgi:ribose-phosphate pyrophosphokinase
MKTINELYRLISDLSKAAHTVDVIDFSNSKGDMLTRVYPNFEDYKSYFAITQFNGGETYVKVPTGRMFVDKIRVAAVYPFYEFDVALVCDALSSAYPDAELVLDIKYLPHGRQDRVCKPGEAFASKLFFGLMANAGVSIISTMGVHSKALFDIAEQEGVKLIDTLEDRLTKLNTESPDFLEGYDAIVAPDEGAAERCKLLAGILNIPVIQCTKQRLPDGSIVTQVPDGTEQYKDVLVFDDICDAGGTFESLIKVLPNDVVSLLVVHGIFANNAKRRLHDVGYEWVNSLN